MNLRDVPSVLGTHAPRVRCFLLDTGYCLGRESHAIIGGAHRPVAWHSLVALIHHPAHGWLLWDTGYAPRMLDATAHWPARLYRLATPLRLRPELAVARQIARYGLAPHDIQHIVLSHFHADHVAGLRDFPQATIIASASAYADATARRGLGALRRGLLPALLPADFASRANLLSPFAGEPLGPLGATHDLFGDGSLLLVALPGHAHGQVGMLAQTERGAMLFAADSCWLSRSIREGRPPARITHLLVDDPRAVARTIYRLHAFAHAYPQVRIVPSHCPEVFAAFATPDQARQGEEARG